MTSLGPNRRCRRVNKEDLYLFDSTGANTLLDEFTLVQMEQVISDTELLFFTIKPFFRHEILLCERFSVLVISL